MKNVSSAPASRKKKKKKKKRNLVGPTAYDLPFDAAVDEIEVYPIDALISGNFDAVNNGAEDQCIACTEPWTSMTNAHQCVLILQCCRIAICLHCLSRMRKAANSVFFF